MSILKVNYTTNVVIVLVVLISYCPKIEMCKNYISVAVNTSAISTPEDVHV